METLNQQIVQSVDKALQDLNQVMTFNERTLLVIGCSTSEVLGNRSAHRVLKTQPPQFTRH
ncbi:hypothetical protein NBRC111894_3414 [Sporolactobacillus inulinus]|uniref:Uncharacterized protein n=1 Tax=Sporolactobacillus inulinus TaxID=2078 RepID=A0A4Y1ZFY3_9BACL|nr:hypothetical protein NBRC111894_3414 [Sporolactobacillus inulinus]